MIMLKNVIMVCLWLFFIFLATNVKHSDASTGLRILDLQIPEVVDYRVNITLNCSFVMGRRELYNVKWYKDDDEFYRFTPNGPTVVNYFPLRGVHLTNETLRGHYCNYTFCAIRLTNLSRVYSTGSYKCEVSGEAPEFELAYNSTKMTVLGLQQQDPKIEGLSQTYQMNEFLSANCSAGPSDPTPVITWLINGKKAPAITIGQRSFPIPDPISGLTSQTVSLRFLVKNYHFINNRITLECTSNLSSSLLDPKIIALTTRSTTATVFLHNQSSSLWHDNERSLWFSYSSAIIHFSNLVFFIIPLVFIN